MTDVRDFYDELAPLYHLAIPPARVAALMTSTGFVDVRRIDGRFFQPILVGTRPPQR